MRLVARLDSLAEITVRHLLWTLSLTLLLACGGGDGGTTPPDDDPDLGPIALAVESGGGVTAPVATEIPTAVVVRVTRAVAASGGRVDPEPVSGQLVNFVVVQGGGTVFAGSAITNDLGEARERWTYGTAAGAQVLEARAVDQDTGEPITFARMEGEATPGPITFVNLPCNEGPHRDPNRGVVYRVGETLDLRDLFVAVSDGHQNVTRDAGAIASQLAAPGNAFGVTLWDGTPGGTPTETRGLAHLATTPINGGQLMIWNNGVRLTSTCPLQVDP